MKAINTGLALACLSLLFFAVLANAGLEKGTPETIESYEGHYQHSRRLAYSFLVLNGQTQDGKSLTADTISYLLALPDQPQIDNEKPVISDDNWLYVSDDLYRMVMFGGCRPGWTVYDIK